MNTINRFSEMDQVNKQLVAECITTTFMVGKCSPEILKKNVTIDNSIDGVINEHVWQELFVLMSTLGIIENTMVMHENDDSLDCIITCWAQLEKDVQDLLIETNHTVDEIRAYLNELPDDAKEIVSAIIRNPDDWEETANNLPAENSLVVIRLYNPTITVQENATQKILLEDLRIGFWDGEKWNIEGPIPFKDYSTLTARSHLAEGTIVSHWRNAETEEINDWHHRYDAINDYGYLDIFVDDENKDRVYRALIHGCNMLHHFAKSNENDEETHNIAIELANTLSDIAGCFDRGGIYNEPEEAYNNITDVITNKIEPLTH